MVILRDWIISLFSLSQLAQHAAAQQAAQQAAAQQGHQLIMDPAKLAGSPYQLVSQATGQSLYGAAAPGFEAVMGQDAQGRQAWQMQAAEQVRHWTGTISRSG